MRATPLGYRASRVVYMFWVIFTLNLSSSVSPPLPLTATSSWTSIATRQLAMPATSPHPLPSYLSSLSPLDNPFLASEQHWTATAWPTPSTGFKPRLIILGCLLLIMLVSSLGNIVLMAISASRRGEKLWAVRLVKRENGR